MKTDSLFYEVFKFDPQSVFELVQLNIQGSYTFESITTKRTERRFDGFLKRSDGTGPNIFLEVQGYNDSKIYWRLFGEICDYYRQAGIQKRAKKKTDETPFEAVVNSDKSRKEKPFIAIVIFIDKKFEPKNIPLSVVSPNQLICVNLFNNLKALKNKASVLTVLKPLAISDVEDLAESARKWKSEIDSLKLPDSKHNTLIELLEYAILQRFPRLSSKELKELLTMIELTPLEKTVAGQELIQIGRKEGIQKGMKKGELIGEIRLAQRILKKGVSSTEELAQKSMKSLTDILSQLLSQFNQ